MRRSVVVVAALVLAVAHVSGQGGRVYPAAKQGGNYMHNYYFPPAPSSTPWAPAWSPDGKSIAVAMSGSIWSVDPSTGAARELTYNGKYHSMPDWSPDGKWIVYTADDGGGTIQLEMVNVQTGESRTLTNDTQIYMDPAFSPDGTRVAYVATKPNGNFNVFIRAIKDGLFTGEEIAVTRDNDFKRDRLYFGNMDMHITPAWLPDGKELLIVSNRNVPLGSGNPRRPVASTRRRLFLPSRRSIARGRMCRSTANASSIPRRRAPPINSTTSTCSRLPAASPTR
jgi:TolB protein